MLGGGGALINVVEEVYIPVLVFPYQIHGKQTAISIREHFHRKMSKRTFFLWGVFDGIVNRLCRLSGFHRERGRFETIVNNGGSSRMPRTFAQIFFLNGRFQTQTCSERWKRRRERKKKAQVMQRVQMDAEICRDVEGT